MISTTTPLPSNSSDLDQALLALRELVLHAPAGTDPWFVSALQQARTVLRRHEARQDPARNDPTPPQDRDQGAAGNRTPRDAVRARGPADGRPERRAPAPGTSFRAVQEGAVREITPVKP